MTETSYSDTTTGAAMSRPFVVRFPKPVLTTITTESAGDDRRDMLLAFWRAQETETVQQLQDVRDRLDGIRRVIDAL